MLSSIKLMQLDILIFSSNEMNQVDEREVDNEDDAILDVDDEEERPSNANTHYDDDDVLRQVREPFVRLIRYYSVVCNID